MTISNVGIASVLSDPFGKTATEIIDVYKRQVLYALKDFLIKWLGSLLEHIT